MNLKAFLNLLAFFMMSYILCANNIENNAGYDSSASLNNANAKKNFVLHTIPQLPPKSSIVINEISNAIYDKTKFSIYVNIIEDIPKDMKSKNVTGVQKSTSLADDKNKDLTSNVHTSAQANTQTNMQNNAQNTPDIQDLKNSQESQNSHYVQQNAPSVQDSQNISNTDFNKRRNYESMIAKDLQKPFAIIFFYYKSHKINIVSSENFIDSKELLDQYAFPYLPAEKIGSDKFDEGVNNGLSNTFLALSREVAAHYNVKLDLPPPLEQPSGALKGIIYAMIFILVALFLAVRFKLFKAKK